MSSAPRSPPAPYQTPHPPLQPLGPPPAPHGDPASGVLRTELNGNDWLFPAGHTIELQVGQVDAPMWRPDNEPSSIAISSVHVRFPTPHAGTVSLQPAG